MRTNGSDELREQEAQIRALQNELAELKQLVKTLASKMSVADVSL